MEYLHVEVHSLDREGKNGLSIRKLSKNQKGKKKLGKISHKMLLQLLRDLDIQPHERFDYKTYLAIETEMEVTE